MTFPLALHCPAASLFHDASGTASADLDIDGHRKPSPFAADSFGIGCDVDEETGSAASTKTIRSVVDLLEARAQFDAPERTVHILAEHDGGTYLDLADTDWRAVQIGPDGWQVHQSGSVVPPCCHFLCRREADRSKRSQHS